MSYFLRIENKKKGPYLQLYERYWNKEKRQCRTKCVKTFGYLDDLKNEYMSDPVAYYKEYAANLNRKKKEKAVNYKGSGDAMGEEEFIQLPQRGTTSAAEMGDAEGPGGAGAAVGLLQRTTG